ncbi:PREDICTED: larval/pupal cuticle protein H1C-like [Nicrophorus vespilloides]|uniref:Larval/pupal cuticle protein H1C-like n=1 Tax=Nicrophorus vespilloides TaxID=110193 RepID=A0ABM1MKB3_NICVS|nr:PREDICTED: larval/pupal cuticle protein H1C-like [Nicrophorus vespilloides]
MPPQLLPTLIPPQYYLRSFRPSSYLRMPPNHAAPIAVGTTSQSVVRSLGGAQAVSHYSKAEDSAFSTVRKYDTRITNDAYSFAHAAPVATYAAPVVAKAAYAAPVATYAHAAPVATYAHAAPLATYAHAAPVAKAAITYSPASVVSHTSFAGLGAHYEW